MTPTASASPITLLTTVVDPANTASATVDNTSTAAPDGGFQLLIAAATEQQLGSQLGAALQKNLPNTSSTSAEPPSDGGNVLPPTGLLLPSATEQPALSQDELDKALASSKDDATDETKPATDDAAIQLLWVPVNIQAAAPPPSDKVGSSNVLTTAIDSAGSGKSQTGAQSGTQAISDATTAQLAGAEQNAAAKKADGTAQLAADADVAANIAAQDNNFMPAKQAPAGHSAKTANDPLVAVPSADAKIDPALLNAAAATKSTEGSNFAEVLKPETAAQAATGAPTAVLDTGRTTPQSTRPYAEMNTATATVALPVGSNGWSDAVVDKVMWFSANQLSNAEIKLNPPDLGPLQVRISTQHDQASVVFSSPHAAVRDALDQALPRLRDMLGGQGIQLSDASVGGQGASRQQQQGGENRAPNPSFFRSEDNGDTPIAVTRVIGSRLSSSAVDAYA